MGAKAVVKEQILGEEQGFPAPSWLIRCRTHGSAKFALGSSISGDAGTISRAREQANQGARALDLFTTSHAVLRGEQRRIQARLATLSGGSLHLASHQEDEEQEDVQGCLEQPSAPVMMPQERGRRLSEFSQEDLAKVRAAAEADFLATRAGLLAELCDGTSQSEDGESELQEEEDDGEEGQGQEQEDDDNSLVVGGVDTVAGHGTPKDVAGAQELSECPTIRKSLAQCLKMELIFLLRHRDEEASGSTDFNKMSKEALLQRCRQLGLKPRMISELPQDDLSKLRVAALDRSTKKKNNRLGREEDILREDNANGTDQPTPWREGDVGCGSRHSFHFSLPGREVDPKKYPKTFPGSEERRRIGVMEIPLDVAMEKPLLEEKTSLSTTRCTGPWTWSSPPPTGADTSSGPTTGMDSTITTESSQVMGLFMCLRGCRRASEGTDVTCLLTSRHAHSCRKCV